MPMMVQQPQMFISGIPAPRPNQWSTELFDVCAEPGGIGRFLYTLIFPGDCALYYYVFVLTILYHHILRSFCSEDFINLIITHRILSALTT